MNTAASSPYSFNIKTFERTPNIKNISETECQRNRTSFLELVEQRIKNSILSLKLWIVTTVVLFLFSAGGTLMCAMRTAGQLEERIENLSSKQETLQKSVDFLREEIWKRIPIPSAHIRTVGDDNDDTTTKATQSRETIYYRYASGQ